MDSMGLSKDRRRFIVISIFDASFATLLWLIYLVSLKDDWVNTLIAEVNIFNPRFIHTSLFDVVLCAFFRMLVLIICYAILVVKHWFPVALTTAISSIFLIVKAMLYFSKANSGPLQYMLVLGSFSVAWFELWLMPFKVLRRERRYTRHYDSDDDDVPEIVQHSSSHPPRAPNRVVERLTARQNHFHSTDDEANFRSALEYSSDEEHRRRITQPQIPAMMREIYEKAIYEAEKRTATLLSEARRGNWKVLRADGPMVLHGPDQSYFIAADFPCQAALLFDAVWKNVLQWNPQVLQGKTILTLDSQTELFYSVSAPAMKGYISSRDFLDVRRVRVDTENNEYTGVFASVESTLCPANINKKIIRGSNGPSVFRVTSSADGTESHMEWVMKTDLRGGLPKRLVQSSMLTYFCDHMDRLRKHIDSLVTN